MHATWQHIRDLAESAGCIVVKKKWPGNGTPGVLQATNATDLAHELAHWYIATPEEKKHKWLGLGNPHGSGTDQPLIEDEDLRDSIEAAAATLGLLLIIEAKATNRVIQKAFRKEVEDNVIFLDCVDRGIEILKERSLWTAERGRAWDDRIRPIFKRLYY